MAHLSIEQWCAVGGLLVAGGYPIIKGLAARYIKTELYWHKVDTHESVLFPDGHTAEPHPK